MVKQRRPRRVKISLEDTKYNILTTARRKLAWTEVDIEDDWDICWIDSSVNISRIIRLAPHQKLNHFMGMMELCRKKSLARNMSTMATCFPRMYNFTPQTFNLPQAMERALAALKNGRRTFILKPDGGSQMHEVVDVEQGKGIRLVQTPEQLREALEDMPSCEVVMSRYLHRPLLLRGCKFDLRIYVLVTSCHPLRIFVYEEGLVRFCTQRYEAPAEENLGKRFMHITNFAVNRQNGRRSSSADPGVLNDTKWSLSDLRRYMMAARQPFDPLWEKIRHIIVLSLLSIQPQLRHHYMSARPNAEDEESVCFELLGYDIMIDECGKPWLLEVNHSPSFSTEMAVDRSVKEQLLRDTLIMVQPEFADTTSASCPTTPTHPPSTPADLISSARRRDAHEALYCGAYRRAYPSADPRMQDKYEMVLQAAEGAFEMSIVARAHRTVSKIQERRKRLVEEEAERAKQRVARAAAARARARRRASEPQQPIQDPRAGAKLRVMAKQSLSLPRMSVDVQFGCQPNPEVIKALKRLENRALADPQSALLDRCSSESLPDSPADSAASSEAGSRPPTPRRILPAPIMHPWGGVINRSKHASLPKRIDLDCKFVPAHSIPYACRGECEGRCSICSLPSFPGIVSGLNPLPSPGPAVAAHYRSTRAYASDNGDYVLQVPAHRPELRRVTKQVVPAQVSMNPTIPKPPTPPRPVAAPANLWPATLKRLVEKDTEASVREIYEQMMWQASRPARRAFALRGGTRTADV